MKKTKYIFRIFICIMLIVMMLPFTGKLTDVFAAASDIKLNVKTARIVRGNTFALNIYNTDGTETVEFTSADEDIATVEADGTVTAVACGTTRITVTVSDESGKQIAKLRCKITVGLPAISVKFTKSELVLTVGKRKSLKTLVYPGNSIEKPQFYSEDTSIVTVTSSGRVTAKAIGATYVYAFLDNGKYDTCLITVEEVPEEEIAEPVEDSEDDTDETQTVAPVTETVTPIIENNIGNIIPSGSIN